MEKQIIFPLKHKIPGIYILQKMRNYANLKIQNGKALRKLNIGIHSKFGQYYRYDITMYDHSYHTVFNPYLELDFQNDAGK